MPRDNKDAGARKQMRQAACNDKGYKDHSLSKKEAEAHILAKAHKISRNGKESG